MVQLITELKEVVDWFRLGIYLGIESANLKAIEDGNQDTEGQKLCMLMAWTHAAEEPRWLSIVNALREMGNYTIAERLENKYGGWSPIKLTMYAD